MYDLEPAVEPLLESRGQNQKNNLAIFSPFLDFHEFFDNRGLTFQTSDPHFCDLLNELFHMAPTQYFENKNLILTSYFKFPCN